MECCKDWSFLKPLEHYVDKTGDTSPIKHLQEKYGLLDTPDDGRVEKARALIKEVQFLLSPQALVQDRPDDEYSQNKTQPKDSFFRKRGAVWTFRYLGGNEIYLKNVDKGCEYINLLLAHPGELRSVYEIACAREVSLCQEKIDSTDIEGGFQVTSGFPLGDSGYATDQKSIQQYIAEAQRLFDEKEEALAAKEIDRVQSLDEEMATLADHISSVQGRGGKIRKSNDVRKRVRDAFRKAVNRAIEEIRKYDLSLADHFDDDIKFGNDVGYLPKESIDWELRPIANK
jgi:hypothetical protein